MISYGYIFRSVLQDKILNISHYSPPRGSFQMRFQIVNLSKHWSPRIHTIWISELGKWSQLLFSPLSVKEQYTNGSTFSFWSTRSSIMLLVTLQCFQALPITDIPTGECALVCFLFPFPCRYDSHWKLLWPFLPFYLEHIFKSTLEEVSQVTVNHFQVSSTSGRYKKFISLTLLAKQAFLLISPCHPNNRWQSDVLC